MKSFPYVYFVIERDMKREIYIEGIGWCIERTIYRVNENGINEPYTMYEPLNK